jgi:hypothetical protein
MYIQLIPDEHLVPNVQLVNDVLLIPDVVHMPSLYCTVYTVELFSCMLPTTAHS